jgi:hypothetical protein
MTTEDQFHTYFVHCTGYAWICQVTAKDGSFTHQRVCWCAKDAQDFLDQYKKNS